MSTQSNDSTIFLTIDSKKFAELLFAVSEQKRIALENINDYAPGLNPLSPKQVKEKLGTSSSRISELREKLDKTLEFSDDWFLIFGIIEFLTAYYFHKNYLLCIAKHRIGDQIEVIQDHGDYYLPNKQPLFHDYRMWFCIKNKNLRDKALIQHHRTIF